MMKGAVFTQALLLAGTLDRRQQALLEVLCSAAVAALAGRLREGIAPEDHWEEFVTAACFYALADLKAMESAGVEEFKAGDLTVKSGSGDSGEALQREAEKLMKPWLQDSFAFLGV